MKLGRKVGLNRHKAIDNELPHLRIGKKIQAVDSEANRAGKL